MSGMDYTVSGVFFKGNMLFYDENKLKMSPAGSEAPYFTIMVLQWMQVPICYDVNGLSPYQIIIS